MKSPWKFIAKLIPQRRAAAIRESSLVSDAAVEDDEAQRAPTQPLDQGSATELSDLAGLSGELVTLHGSHSRQSKLDVSPLISEPVDVTKSPAQGGSADVLPSSADERETHEASESRKAISRRPRATKPRAPASTRIEVASKSNAAKITSRLAQSQPAQNGFLDEAARLDEEIKLLKTQLAQRLRSQNLQLQTMLKRFDI